jgi:hypothetical protein
VLQFKTSATSRFTFNKATTEPKKQQLIPKCEKHKLITDLKNVQQKMLVLKQVFVLLACRNQQKIK